MREPLGGMYMINLYTLRAYVAEHRLALPVPLLRRPDRLKISQNIFF